MRDDVLDIDVVGVVLATEGDDGSGRLSVDEGHRARCGVQGWRRASSPRTCAAVARDCPADQLLHGSDQVHGQWGDEHEAVLRKATTSAADTTAAWAGDGGRRVACAAAPYFLPSNVNALAACRCSPYCLFHRHDDIGRGHCDDVAHRDRPAAPSAVRRAGPARSRATGRIRQ